MISGHCKSGNCDQCIAAAGFCTCKCHLPRVIPAPFSPPMPPPLLPPAAPRGGTITQDNGHTARVEYYYPVTPGEAEELLEFFRIAMQPLRRLAVSDVQ